MDVEFDGVRVERDRRITLDVPTLRFRGGRTTAILGPNGSGKTTLLRVIAGLERLRTGRIRVGGTPLAARPNVAFVFQEQVFLRQSVRENLELGLRLRGVGEGQRGARIAEAARMMGIDDLLERRADRLSGGEGRRVSIARALCLRAPLVLLDEPLEGLDERTYSRLLDELPQVLAAFGATALLVTHTRHEALRLADDLVILVDGRVHAAGAKQTVVTDPPSALVADVLGYTVLRAGNRLLAVPPGAWILGPGEPAFDLVVDDVVDVVDRREAIGSIDGIRVRVGLLPADRMPCRGERMRVHASRYAVLPGGV